MRIKSRCSVLAGLAFCALSAFAQQPELVIDNNAIFQFESNATDWMTLDANGRVTINSTGAGGVPVQPLSCSRGSVTSPSVSLGGVPVTTVTSGQSFTLTWNSANTQTGNSTPCTRSGTNGTGWANGGPVTGQPGVNASGIQVTIPSTATDGQTFNFTMQCVGNGGTSGQDTRTVTVLNGPSCPANNVHGLQVISPSTWPGNFRSPSGIGPGASIPMSSNQCLAMAFNSGQFGTPPRWTGGRIEFFTQTGALGTFSLSYSRCPCDFRPALNDNNQQCRTFSAASKLVLGWKLIASPGAPTNGQCGLLTNTDYFVNVAYGPGTEPSNPLGQCFSGACPVFGSSVCGENCQ